MRKSEHKIRRVASGRLAVDSSGVNGGNVSVTQRTVERDFAILQKAGIIRHEAGIWVVLENFKQLVLDNDRQFVFQTDTKRGRHG